MAVIALAFVTFISSAPLSTSFAPHRSSRLIDFAGQLEDHTDPCLAIPQYHDHDCRAVGRREAMGALVAVAASAAAASFAVSAAHCEEGARVVRSPRPLLYEVLMTHPYVMQPYKPRGEPFVVEGLARRPAVVLGGHGNAVDATLEARLIGQFSDALGGGGRGVVVALAGAVASERARAAIDAFVTGGSDEAVLSDSVDWAEGSGGADGQVPLLRAARACVGRGRDVRVVAVGLPPGLVNAVRSQGLAALGPAQARELVADPEGFMAAVNVPGFKKYADVVIGDVFDRHAAGNASSEASGAEEAKGSGAADDAADGSEGVENGSVPGLANFFAAHILVDEVIASRAFAAISQSSTTQSSSSPPGPHWRGLLSDGAPETPLLVLVAEADRVKFGFGVHARLERIAASHSPPRKGKQAGDAADNTDTIRVSPSDVSQIKSVLVNPTARDSLNIARNLRLCLSGAEDVASSRPLADYVFFSESPQPNLLTRMRNPISGSWFDVDNIEKIRFGF